MIIDDVGAEIWKILTPYVVGSIVSMTAALVVWIIRTFNSHSEAVQKILFILSGAEGKNGMQAELKDAKSDISDLKTDVTKIKTTLKLD